MKLTKENFKQWKKELDALTLKTTGIKNISQSISKKDWIDQYEGEEPDLAVKDLIDSMND